MKENEPDPREKLCNHYLEDEQLDYLFERYFALYQSLSEEHMDSVELPDLFLIELCLWWAAYEIETKDFYRQYVRNMLIPADYIYDFRDYFINYVIGKFTEE